jgi:hypothetical protein
VLRAASERALNQMMIGYRLKLAASPDTAARSFR